MIKFLLMLYFGDTGEDTEDLTEDESAAFIGRSITKLVEMPVIPRVGELIQICPGFWLGVAEVQHNIKEGLVNVVCNSGVFLSAIAYAEDKQGWNLEQLSSYGKRIFLKNVKAYGGKRSRKRKPKASG